MLEPFDCGLPSGDSRILADPSATGPPSPLPGAPAKAGNSGSLSRLFHRRKAAQRLTTAALWMGTVLAAEVMGTASWVPAYVTGHRLCSLRDYSRVVLCAEILHDRDMRLRGPIESEQQQGQEEDLSTCWRGIAHALHCATGAEDSFGHSTVLRLKDREKPP